MRLIIPFKLPSLGILRFELFKFLIHMEGEFGRGERAWGLIGLYGNGGGDLWQSLLGSQRGRGDDGLGHEPENKIEGQAYKYHHKGGFLPGMGICFFSGTFLSFNYNPLWERGVVKLFLMPNTLQDMVSLKTYTSFTDIVNNNR
jgi:hypothetical protein